MKKRRQSGVTMVALVVTIIILIILASVTLNLVNRDRSNINMSKDALEQTEIDSEIQTISISSSAASGKNKYGIMEQEELEGELDKITGVGKTTVEKYANGNKFLITFKEKR